MTRTLLGMLLAVTVAPQMTMRGNQVMGFDQDKTTHHFLLYPDGGAIDVSAKDAKDSESIAAIRSHLPHIAVLFSEGDFSAPMLVHDTVVPGTKVMAARKDTLSFKYSETSKGGRVDIFTTDKTTLDAVYEFLRFQISDHKTGDNGLIVKR